MSKLITLPFLTVGLTDWEVQTEIVSRMNDRDDGYLDGLLAWMEELKRRLDEGPLIVATNSQVKLLMAVASAEVLEWENGVTLTGVRVLNKTYHEDGQLASITIEWDKETPSENTYD